MPPPSAQEILSAVRRAAARYDYTSAEEACACYLLRVDGHLSFKQIKEEIDLESAQAVMVRFNRVSMARIAQEWKIVRIIDSARDEMVPSF